MQSNRILIRLHKICTWNSLAILYILWPYKYFVQYTVVNIYFKKDGVIRNDHWNRKRHNSNDCWKIYFCWVCQISESFSIHFYLINSPALVFSKFIKNYHKYNLLILTMAYFCYHWRQRLNAMYEHKYS